MTLFISHVFATLHFFSTFPLIDGSCGYLSFVPFTNIRGQMVKKNTICKCKGQSRGNPHPVTGLSYKILQNCTYKSSYQVDFVIYVKSDCLRQYSPVIISWQTPFRQPLYTGTVHVLGQCQLCLLIQVVFPVILSSWCKHLQLFTVKCPLCSPSLPVCFQH